jgi:branched-chain amino acid aminotransferase
MAAEFSLSIYPWVYLSKFDGESWDQRYLEKRHLTPAAEEALPEAEREQLYRERNEFPGLPLVNYTTQYAMACFEGLKAFPQPDGSLKLFRPHENGVRMQRSMEGLYMPGVPADQFVAAARGVVARNQALGFAPAYDPAWERDEFESGHSVYVRPFSYAEAGIGVNLCEAPYFIVVSTRVGAYFGAGDSSPTVTTRRIRATPGGTGWIKCSANYVTSALAKREAEVAGFIECVFLDAEHHRYVEEGSSCNLFFVLGDGRLVTPALGDTILPGITRRTILELAAEEGMTVEERPVAVEEVLDDAVEAFGTGTAAGVTYFSSLRHGDTEKVFGDGAIGPVARGFLKTLKGVQYGALEDRHGWMVPVAGDSCDAGDGATVDTAAGGAANGAGTAARDAGLPVADVAAQAAPG